MKKYFVVGDVHAFWVHWEDALDQTGFDVDDPDHILVSLGDLLDRGEDPVACLEHVNALPKNRKILVRGNHEDLLEECLVRQDFWRRDVANGTASTVAKLCGKRDWESVEQADYEVARSHPALTRYLADLVDFAEVGDYVFVHGRIPSGIDWREGDWYRARWQNGMERWAAGERLAGKTVVCGHWHTSWGHCFLEGKGSEFGESADFSPFAKDGILAVDGCTAYSHVVNCVVLEV